MDFLSKFKTKENIPDNLYMTKHRKSLQSDPFAFNVAYRRLGWMFKTSVAINIGLSIAVITLTNTISALVPLKTTEIALVKADPDDNRIYRIEPITKEVEGFDLAMESTARFYVRNLLEIDAATQNERLEAIRKYTSKAYHEKFTKERIDTNEIDDAIASGLNRSITIESVNRLETQEKNYKYVVDFVQTDRRRGKIIEQKQGRAYMVMSSFPQEVPEAERFENPLGIVVLDLVIKEKGNA